MPSSEEPNDNEANRFAEASDSDSAFSETDTLDARTPESLARDAEANRLRDEYRVEYYRYMSKALVRLERIDLVSYRVGMWAAVLGVCAVALALVVGARTAGVLEAHGIPAVWSNPVSESPDAIASITRSYLVYRGVLVAATLSGGIALLRLGWRISSRLRVEEIARPEEDSLYKAAGWGSSSALDS